MGRHSIPDPDESDEQPDAGEQDNPDEQPHPDDQRVADDDEDSSDWADPTEPDDGRGHGEHGDGDEGYSEVDHWAPDAESGYLESDSDHDEPEDPTRSFAATTPPTSGPQHDGDWEGGEWTGSHRAVTASPRGVSKGVIAALVAVVVVVGAVILWRFFGDALSDRSEIAAARCVSGDVAVAVIADPSIAEHISSLAEEYNKTAAPVGDSCVKVGVTSADSGQVIDGFAGKWPSQLGERPALWIPGSSVSSARLEAAAGPQTVSVSRSLVSSPVMLAMRPELKNVLAQQNWGALPGLQSNPTALDGLNLPGWGALRLALPLTEGSDATYAAAEAVAAADAPDGGPATAGAGAVTTLVAGQPKLADGKASTALDALLRDGPAATAPVHAVVSTEQQIYQRAAALPDAEHKLAAWLPSGPTALADYPSVQLSGDWVSREQAAAASEFDRYLRKPEAQAELVKAGFRADVDGTALPTSDVIEFGALKAPLSVGDNAARATLAEAVSAATQSPVVTILLDQSMDTTEGEKSRVDNVTAALTTRLQTLPPTAAVGLWTFDGVTGRSEVATGPLGDPVNGQPRSAVLAANLDGQTASNGGAVSFTSLRLLYNEAVANFRDGQKNSVLVITAGPHTDRTLDGPGLQEFIKATFAPARPVAVKVINFGDDPDRATWEAVARTTGGSYQNLGNSAGPELAAAIATMVR
jgi:Bacterial extracellular solute-binding protein